MGRKRSQKQEHEWVAKSLVDHGIPRSFAVKVADEYTEKGAPSALTLLYAGGWELHIEWHGDHPRERVLQLRRCLNTKGGNGGTEKK